MKNPTDRHLLGNYYILSKTDILSFKDSSLLNPLNPSFKQYVKTISLLYYTE